MVYYITPAGAGARTGASWADAGTLAQLPSFVSKAGAGGQVLLRADEGPYRLDRSINLWAGGAQDAPVLIRGVTASGRTADAVFQAATPGIEAFRINPGADHLRFEAIDLYGVQTGFRVTGDVSDLGLRNIEGYDVGRLFDTYASTGTATVSGLDLVDIRVSGFTKGVVRLRDNTNDVTIDGLHANARGVVLPNFVMGVQLEGTVHDVLIVNSSVRNINAQGVGYWNGDGFATERGVHDVTFRNVSASGNSDAGFDIKSSSTRLYDVTASDNSRNFRFWADDTLADGLTAAHPRSRGGTGSPAQVWLADGAAAFLRDLRLDDHGAIATTFDLAQDGAVLTLDGVSGTLADPFAHAFVAPTSRIVADGVLAGASAMLADAAMVQIA